MGLGILAVSFLAMAAADILEAVTPRTFSFQGTEQVREYPLKDKVLWGKGPKVEFEVEWTCHAERDRIALREGERGVWLQAPLRLSGQGGAKGFLAEALKLNRRPARGTALLWIECRMRWDAGRPKVVFTPVLQWTQRPEIEVKDDWWVSVQEMADGELAKVLVPREYDLLAVMTGAERVGM